MPDLKENNVQGKNPELQGSAKKSNGVGFVFVSFLMAVVIMLSIFYGFFWFFVSNNVNNVAERHRETIQKIPFLKNSLPKAPDPEDPKYLSEAELRSKYLEVVDEKDQLLSKTQNLEEELKELNEYKDEKDKREQEKKAFEAEKDEFEQKKSQLKIDQENFIKEVSENDKDGYKKFYENLYKDTATKIYQEILGEEKKNQGEIDFARIFEQMEPDSAAKILEEMGNNKIDLIVSILKNIKKDSSAEIIAELDPDFASQVSEKLNEEMKKQ